MYITQTLKHYIPGTILFAFCVILSLCIYKDYGVSWDEPWQREIGTVSYDYIVKSDNTLDTYLERDHGTGFEIPLIVAEKVFNRLDTPDIYYMRHQLSNLFFLLGCFFGYILSYRLFRNNVIACIGFLMLVFQPRIFAHSFFNTKDVPFLSAFTIALAFTQVAFDKNKWWWFLFTGLVCGYTTSIRILGILLVCGITVFLVIDLIQAVHKKQKTAYVILNMAIFLFGFALALYTCFPTLWKTPLKSFAEVFGSLSHFRWGGVVLFQGKIMLADTLPWTYIPVWFGITMPIVWLVAGIAGISLVFFDMLRSPVRFLLNTWHRNFALYSACFLLPILSVILMKSVVYDDWRHVYFVYPSFVLLSLYCLSKLNGRRLKPLFILVFLVQFVAIGHFMVSAHPHQQVYFNRLVSHKPESLRKNYDLEYWGCSFKQGLQYILDNDTSSSIKVYCPLHTAGLTNNNYLFPYPLRQRLQVTAVESEANYVLGNYRQHPDDYKYPNPVYDIKVCNSTILKVYKVR